ncbi:hypothetical protein ABID97_001907 [Variovorax sp. OAS795]|uniref:hypothetical protein n=1 Tax=Variovorax sp. OAS795 TaxID=3034231 RepID=UPI003397CDB7
MNGTALPEVRVLDAAAQREVDSLWLLVHREDKWSANLAQIARLESLLQGIVFTPGATDWASLRARMNALGGSVARTHPDDGPLRYIMAIRDASIVYERDTLDEVIQEVADEEVEAAWALESGKGHAAWKAANEARKARKAARMGVPA